MKSFLKIESIEILIEDWFKNIRTCPTDEIMKKLIGFKSFYSNRLFW